MHGVPNRPLDPLVGCQANVWVWIPFSMNANKECARLRCERVFKSAIKTGFADRLERRPLAADPSQPRGARVSVGGWKAPLEWSQRLQTTGLSGVSMISPTFAPTHHDSQSFCWCLFVGCLRRILLSM